MRKTFQVGGVVSVLTMTALLSACGGGGSSSSDEPLNSIPVANDDLVTLTQDASKTGSVAVNDVESVDGSNVWVLVSDVDNGTLNFSPNGDFSYTPDSGYYGSDDFTYYIEDQDGDRSEIAVVSISVTSSSVIPDQFISHQWYLENIGQSALTVYGSGGTVGADVRLPNAGSSIYALGFTGEGVQVAIIDNALEIAHEDLAPNILANASYNFFTENGKDLHDPTPPDSVPNPNGHHGTAVAGLAAARGGNEVGIWGVAPQVELIGYNLLYSGFTLTDELAAIGYGSAVNDFPELYSESVDIFNMSYGRNPYEGTNENPGYTPEILAGLKSGTEVLRDAKGAIYIKAGGNEYYGGTAFVDGWCDQAEDNNISCYNTNMENENVTPYQMIIGAFNADDERSSYSNTGSALWMVGPGGEFGVNYPALITTDASGCTNGFSQNQSTVSPYNESPFTSNFNTGESGTGNENCHYFSAFNGSSSATPVVSGIAALMLEANPALSWRDVKHILATTARQLNPDLADNVKDLGTVLSSDPVILEAGWLINNAGYHYSNTYGFGAPDAEAAIQMALDWKTNPTTLPAFKSTVSFTGSIPADNEIPDYDSGGLSPLERPSVTVNDNYVIESVELVISIDDLAAVATDSDSNNIDMSDYQIVLQSPAGTQSVLLTPYNAYQSGHDMIDLKLISHAFYDENSQGVWTLIVRDLDNSTNNRIGHVGEGKLTEWSLKVYGR
ncbi:MAG: S8 family serine peptidase [Pseudomonadota bacterium]|nr:S8 family serine peptidase [Pseudomonadota bacterium]